MSTVVALTPWCQRGEERYALHFFVALAVEIWIKGLAAHLRQGNVGTAAAGGIAHHETSVAKWGAFASRIRTTPSCL
jgi:hypothetical protein